MTEFELNNIKDRMFSLESKIHNMRKEHSTILGKNDQHVLILKNGLMDIKTALGYDNAYNVIVRNLSHLEEYYTVLNKSQ